MYNKTNGILPEGIFRFPVDRNAPEAFTKLLAAGFDINKLRDADGPDYEKDTRTFDDVYKLRADQVTRITAEQGMYLHKTDVLLVRSTTLPESGDHYIVITGHNVVKSHGIRPQTVSFPAIQEHPILELYDGPGEHLVLLKLNREASQAFLNFYGIRLDAGCNVVIDNVENLLAV